LLCLFAQLLFSARFKSPTIDEPNHLARGYAYLKTGDLRLSRDEGHPPLFNTLCALPLSLLSDLALPTYLSSWTIAYRNAFAIEFVFGGAVPVERLFFLGRLPVMLTVLCLAALIARWARELYGTWASLVALALCAFDPNLIAHGRLMTTDMGITFFLFLAVYLFWRFLRGPSLGWLILSGVAVGLAQGVKFSAIVILPMLGLLGLIEATSPQSHLYLPRHLRLAGRRWLSGVLALGGVMVIIVALAGLTIWAIYGFDIGSPAGWSIPVPAPGYIEGLDRTLIHASEIGHPTFLMGRHSTHGWWYYFPVAFIIKTPLPALLALLCALISNVYTRFSRAEWPLLLIPLIYFGLSMRSRLNIGYRHLLPMLPFLWVYVGRLAPTLVDRFKGAGKRWAVAGATAFTLWFILGTLSIAPDYLAYFNALVGGSDEGWRYLADSNLDWGQELPAIKAYAERQSVPRLHLSWFGSTYPHLYGLDVEYRLLPSHFSYPYPRDATRSAYNPRHPAPGLYAIGATNLQGVGLAAGDVFARFREQEPVARVGHSILIYQVPGTSDGNDPTCISGLRFKDLTLEAADLSLGRGPGAVKWFDHATSFILPAAGEPAFVLPLSPLTFVPPWQTMFLDAAEVVYQQVDQGRFPAAVVYHLDRASADEWREAVVTSLSSRPLSWSPAIVFDDRAETYPLVAPVSFDHGLELMGYLLSGETLRPGQTFELVTVWRVMAEMPAQASDLEVFAHLLDEQSKMWAAEDRLDLHPPTWEPGDVLIQYHRLPLAADAPPGTYQLEIGLYTAITMRRLSVLVDGTQVADRLLLQPIQVIEP
jgi:hypothetical protein